MERHGPSGRGSGDVDAGLLAPALLPLGARLRTEDRRLRAAAEGVGVARSST